MVSISFALLIGPMLMAGWVIVSSKRTMHKHVIMQTLEKPTEAREQDAIAMARRNMSDAAAARNASGDVLDVAASLAESAVASTATRPASSPRREKRPLDQDDTTGMMKYPKMIKTRSFDAAEKLKTKSYEIIADSTSIGLALGALAVTGGIIAFRYLYWTWSVIP